MIYALVMQYKVDNIVVNIIFAIRRPFICMHLRAWPSTLSLSLSSELYHMMVKCHRVQTFHRCDSSSLATLFRWPFIPLIVDHVPAISSVAKSIFSWSSAHGTTAFL